MKVFGLFESNEQKADKACANGCMAMLRGARLDAIEYFKKAISLNPAHYEAWNNFGVVLGSFPNAQQEAAKCFEKACSLKPDYQNAIRGLAIVEQKLGHDDHAIELFTKLIDEFGYDPDTDLSLDHELYIWIVEHCHF